MFKNQYFNNFTSLITESAFGFCDSFSESDFLCPEMYRYFEEIYKDL